MDKSTKTVIYRSVGIVVALGLLALVAYFAMNKLQQRVEDARNNPTVVEIPAPETPITDTEYAEKIRKAVLEAYHVTEFPELLYQDADNLLGQTESIVPTNPGSGDGEYTIHFVAEHNLSTWTDTQAQAAADIAMRIVGPQIPEVKGITAEISTWLAGAPGGKGSKPYASLRAGREILGE